MTRGATQQELSSEPGFTLIELLVVIAITLIIASFAAPIYSRIVTHSHEAVLKDDLFTLRQMINRYTLDNHKLVAQGPLVGLAACVCDSGGDVVPHAKPAT